MRPLRTCRFLAACLASWSAVGLAPGVGATVLEVPGSYATIGSALGAASAGDTVLVGCGTYLESDLVVPSGIVLRSATGLPECATLDAQDVAGHLVFDHCDSTTVVEGLTFTRGWGTFSGRLGAWGGSIRGESSDVRIRHCDFVDNDAVYGGALYFSQGSPRVEHCRFEANTATGDGAITASCDTLVVTSSTFVGNRGFEGSGAVWGGIGAVLQVYDCDFVANETTEEGGGLTSRSGRITVERCRFLDNVSRYGAGGLQVSEPFSSIADCEFLRNVSTESAGALLLVGGEHTVTSCVFDRNVTAARGGAIRWTTRSAASGTVVGSTFHANGATNAGAGFSVEGALQIDLDRCSITGAQSGGSIGASGGAAVTATCTNVFGNAGGDWIGPLLGQEGTADNFSADPLYCDAAAGDLTLDAASPCLPQASPCGALVGARAVGCGATAAPATPLRTRLVSVHPNPANPVVTIRFELARPGLVEVRVYDLSGRRVALLAGTAFESGPHELRWAGIDDRGAGVASGVYVVRLDADGVSSQRKIALVR